MFGALNEKAKETENWVNKLNTFWTVVVAVAVTGDNWMKWKYSSSSSQPPYPSYRYYHHSWNVLYSFGRDRSIVSIIMHGAERWIELKNKGIWKKNCDNNRILSKQMFNEIWWQFMSLGAYEACLRLNEDRSIIRMGIQKDNRFSWQKSY